MSGHEYQVAFDARVREGYYPARVEGVETAQGSLYRVAFERRHEGIGFYSHHGVTEEFFTQRNAELTGRGFRLVWVQEFRDGRGVKRYQATWTTQQGSSVTFEPSTRLGVSYRVWGSAIQVDVTYRDPLGRTERTSVTLPIDASWQLLFSASEGQALEISANNTGGGGSVACEIVVDGTPVATSTEEGDRATVSCKSVARSRAR
jgi:hypothetical protein